MQLNHSQILTLIDNGFKLLRESGKRFTKQYINKKTKSFKEQTTYRAVSGFMYKVVSTDGKQITLREI